MNNRLQFRHHSPIFDTREEAIEYIYSQVRFADSGLAFDDKSYGFSLLAEPLIIRYKNEDDADLPSGATPNPHVILAIGANTNESTQYNENRFCIIDIDKTESEIEDIWDELNKAIRGLSIVTKDSTALKLYTEQTEDGTILSGDVVVAESQIFDDARKPNIILNTEEGLFTYVNMEYDPETDMLTFVVNGDVRKLPVNNNYLVRGYYSKKDESLHLIRKDDVDITISLENLIDEWGTEGEATKTPIVLTREEVGYGDDAQHNHVEPWQDVLKADVRLADSRFNILKKTNDGRYLYVDGTANNITYFKDGEEITVAEALNKVTKGLSSDNSNILYEKADGYFATANLRYNNRQNQLVFTASNVTGGTTTETIQLNSVEVFKEIYYDSVTEELVILYVDNNGNVQSVRVPIGQMMQDWEWDIVNDGHNVKLHKQRVIAGNDKVSADVDIFQGNNNILEDVNHQLYVNGTAENIKYGSGTVKDELDKLNVKDGDLNARLNETSGKVDTLRVDLNNEISRSVTEDEAIRGKLDGEISRSREKDLEHDTKINTINATIGDGFSTNGHDTITYKFNELSAKTNSIFSRVDGNAANIALLSAKTEAEIVRAKGEEQRIENKFDDELGDGFSIRNTVRDEIDKEKADRAGADAYLQAQIDAIGGGGMLDITSLDHSIEIDRTDKTKPDLSVNLSTEIEDGKANIIKLNADGIYAGVDLDYYFESGTSKNVLVFKTTNGTKVFDLKTNSVVDKIYYDPTQEAIVIEYTVNGQRMPDVIIPVHDLINEWRPSESTNGAIKLTKFRDTSAAQDVLYAETVIATHEDNILVNDDGALYVSGAQIEKNKADIAALDGRLTQAEADIDALEEGLAEETRRAEGAEAALERDVQGLRVDLDNEIDRAIAEDDAIWVALNAEIARSTGEDARLDRELHDEITRSTNKDNEHDAKLADHETRISNNTSNIALEIERAKEAESALSLSILAETNRATTAEQALRTDLNTEITARETADNILQHNIDDEVNARIAADALLQEKINAEIARASGVEQSIDAKLDDEIAHSIEKDLDLQAQISAEVTRAISSETQEAAARQAGDAELSAAIQIEVGRAQGAEANLQTQITNEKEARENEDAKIWAKIRPIEFYDTTTIHNERVRNTGENPDEVRHNVILANATDNILKASDDLGGLYATVSIGYNQSANALTIYDGSGEDRRILNTVTLGPGSLIKDISYDHTEKDLVVTYRRAGEDEDTVMKFPVADLFNEWDIQNPSEGSALELHKINQTTETGTVDILWGRVLLTGAVERPDGTIDYGDNIIRIVNNGLYASGSAITEAKEVSYCTRSELRKVETAVLGSDLSEGYICGSGFTYTPYERGCVISAATSMYDADILLDEKVCQIDCIWDELNITQENVIGLHVPPCGLNGDGTVYNYPAYPDGCIISAATSLYHADILLDHAICNMGGSLDCAQEEVNAVEDVLGVQGNCAEVINYPRTQGCLLSSATTFANADAILEEAICNMHFDLDGIDTPTTDVTVNETEDGHEFKVDVRLSHGNDMGKWQEDSELKIDSYDGETIESGYTEFTDTNVLRYVDLTETQGVAVDSKYNGLYLSNDWDCGQYTENESDKYHSDSSSTAMNIFNQRYKNSLRYQDE